MTERTEHDRACRAFAGWLLKHTDATNAEREAMKAQLGLTREGPGMVAAVSDRIGVLPAEGVTMRTAGRMLGVGNPDYVGFYDHAAGRAAGKTQSFAPSRYAGTAANHEQRRFEQSLGRIEDPTDVTKGVRAAPPEVRGTFSDTAPELEYAADAAAIDLLKAWLTTPGTVRSVSHMAINEAGVWFVSLTAGGMPYESETQTTLAGAIRSALYGAALDGVR